MYALAAAVSASSGHACITPSYLVSDQPAGAVWLIGDNNDDGDALDLGEKVLWGDGMVAAAGLSVDQQAVYVLESGLPGGSNRIYRFEDLNADGDALDLGERTVFADGFDNPRGIAQDEQGNWFVADVDEGKVWQLRDLNADGDALDLGERMLYADGVSNALGIIAHDGALVTTAAGTGAVHRLNDLNSDGDALDLGENEVIADGLLSPSGLLDDGQGGFYVSAIGSDTVFRATDYNNDGDMLDLIETLSYADAVFGGLDGPWGMSEHHDGGFLVASASSGEIIRVQDANGDGDGLDLGDASLFADGFVFPVGVVRFPEPGVFADLDGDGDVDGVDLSIFFTNFTGPNVGPPPNPAADLDCDGDVDGVDLSQAFSAFTGPLVPANVPEPAVFNGLALIGLVLVRRRDRC